MINKIKQMIKEYETIEGKMIKRLENEMHPTEIINTANCIVECKAILRALNELEIRCNRIEK